MKGRIRRKDELGVLLVRRPGGSYVQPGFAQHGTVYYMGGGVGNEGVAEVVRGKGVAAINDATPRVREPGCRQHSCYLRYGPSQFVSRLGRLTGGREASDREESKDRGGRAGHLEHLRWRRNERVAGQITEIIPR